LVTRSPSPLLFYRYPSPRCLSSLRTRRSSDLFLLAYIGRWYNREKPQNQASSGQKQVERHIFSVSSFSIPRSKAIKSLTILMVRSEEHTSELQSRFELVCRLLLENTKPTG